MKMSQEVKFPCVSTYEGLMFRFSVLLHFMTISTVFIKMDIVPLYRALLSSVSLATTSQWFQFFFLIASKVQLQLLNVFLLFNLKLRTHLVSIRAAETSFSLRASRCKESSFHFKSPSGWRHSRLNFFLPIFNSQVFRLNLINRCCDFCVVSYTVKNHEKSVK